jgi:putative ATPase
MYDNIQETLFKNKKKIPLAEKIRPCVLSKFYGQEHIIGNNKILSKIIEQDNIPSMIFYGPPGCGKTTLAKIISEKTKYIFIYISAVNAAIKDIRDVFNKAKEKKRLGINTILFIDEIHRFNKLQQDIFLPYVENGDITLIGATTENPSFSINNALLSRMKVFVFKKLNEETIVNILLNAINNGFENLKINIDNNTLMLIAKNSNGDARYALSTLEIIVNNSNKNDKNEVKIDKNIIEQCLLKKQLLYDKNGEFHYDLISALHKSMRNSDPDAAVYWLARMLEAGEDPLYIARRLIRFASEDIGLASTKALTVAVDVYNACNYIGMPECNVVLTQGVIFMSLTKKSNSLYLAYESAKKDALEHIEEPVPLHLRNPVTKLMKDMHYGENYKYAHDFKNSITDMKCLPDSLIGKKYYIQKENDKIEK